MKKFEISLRKPDVTDIERMFEMLEKSLSKYLTINRESSKNNQLIIDKSLVKEYINNDKYLCLIAEVDSEIVGWLAGSQNKKVLFEHGCSLEEFYIEEIVVDPKFRRNGIGSLMLAEIPISNVKSIVVDTPLVNKQAIAFYEKSGFLMNFGLPTEFSRTWNRMRKPV